MAAAPWQHQRRPAVLHCNPGGASMTRRCSIATPTVFHSSTGDASLQPRRSSDDPAMLHCNHGGAPTIPRRFIAAPATPLAAWRGPLQHQLVVLVVNRNIPLLLLHAAARSSRSSCRLPVLLFSIAAWRCSHRWLEVDVGCPSQHVA